MLYEPVGYIIEYEISALVFLLIIMVRYFGTRRFSNQKNRLFALILWATVVFMIVDIISSLIIDNVFLIPLPIVFITNTACYLMCILMPLLMMLYTLVLVDYLSNHKLQRILPLFLPGIVLLLMLLSNPLTNWFFFVDPVHGYVHGSMFIFIYIDSLFYLLATFIITLRHKTRLRKNERTSIFTFLSVVLISVFIQFIYPVLLISGVAIAFSVILMYFTIQNPDTMLDTMTGAFTYEAMLVFLQDRMQEQDRVQLVAVKINNMPRINELLGIENGSLLLRQISQFLRESTNDSWVFRMRGGCFVAITRKSDDYRVLSAKLDQRISQPWTVGTTEILLQATVCYVVTEDLLSNPITPAEAVNYLDSALLQNESSGERINSITVGAELVDKIRRSQAVEAALRAAINSGNGLELYFQPLWSVRQQRFTSAEVLLRFNHPTLGCIPPDEFVPIAESKGLVTAMDELVVHKACVFIRNTDHCRNLGLESIEINLSALEFMQRRLPGLINNIISQYQIDPSFLCFEITETAATQSFELVRECMLELGKIGCQFALDDFGTGYANISQVIQLPFSTVKLDKSLLYGPNIVLEDMAKMFTHMQRHTVIEGVETRTQATLTAAMEVDYIQGYYYAKPMNQQDFVQFLSKNTGFNLQDA